MNPRRSCMIFEKKLRNLCRGFLTGGMTVENLRGVVEGELFALNESGLFWNYDFMVDDHRMAVTILVAVQFVSGGDWLYIETDIKYGVPL